MASNTAQKTIASKPCVGRPNVPVALSAPALTISSEYVSVESMLTFFVGIVDDNYPEDQWNEHLNSVRALFGIADDSFGYLKVTNRGDKTVDGEKLACDLRNVMVIINSRPVNKIRVVLMGVDTSPALDQALKALIRGWNIPFESKYIQIVALGDTLDYYLHFCKSLCLNQLCKTVQYYNTKNYDMYGYVDESTGALFRELSRHLVSGFLDK